MAFSNTVVSQRMNQQSSGPDNSRSVAPGHWKREEDNYLTQIGAMHYIMKDPVAQLGYHMQQSADGSGLVMSGDVPSDRYGQFVYPPRPGVQGSLEVGVQYPPTDYGQTIPHELGHAGQYYSTGQIPRSMMWEEARQRFTDLAMYPTTSSAHNDAFEWLFSAGMIDPRKIASPKR